jgi:uncharacterized iron-regulated membrane protein
MKKFLSTLHRWLGFPLGLLFVVTFATGSISAVEEMLKRVDISAENNDYQYRPTTLAENADVLAVITEGKKDIRSIVMPSLETPYYRVEGRGESWTYAINDIENEKHVKDSENGFFKTTLQLHRNYLLERDGLWGIEGKHYAAWVGLIAIAISLLGLWLWWPVRKNFKAKDLVPRGRKRKHFYYNHMTGGVVVLVAILLLAITGASITYRAFTEQLLGVERAKPEIKQAVSMKNNWQTWLEMAYAQMPAGAVLQQIRYPRPPRQNAEKRESPNSKQEALQNNVKPTTDRKRNAPEKPPEQILTFQFHASGDWLGIAASRVNIDKQGSLLVDTSLYSDLSLGEKVFSILKPLHTGHDLPAYYVVLQLLLSLLGTVMVFSGLVSFIIKKRKRIKIDRWANSQPLTES